MKKKIPMPIILLLTLLLIGCSPREQVPQTVDFVVTFVTDGTAVQSVKNKTIESMPASGKEGHILDGWYEDANYTKRVFFPFTATESCTLYAKWINKNTGNDELVFRENDDGTLTVAECSTYCPIIWVPDKYEGKAITVLPYDFLKKIQYVTTIHIGKNVVAIEENFSLCPALNSFEVALGNTHWTSEGGILYSSGKEILYCYPNAKTDEEYTFPDATTEIGKYAFGQSSFLKTINVNEVLNVDRSDFKKMESLERVNVAESNPYISSAEGVVYSSDGTKLLYFPKSNPVLYFAIAPGTLEIAEDAFSGSGILTLNINKELISFPRQDDLPKLTEYEVEEGNAYFVSRDGVLFTDESVLYSVPQGMTSSYSVPAGVIEIADSAFSGCRLSSVIISKDVTKIGRYAFSNCINLETVTFEEDSKLEYIEESAFSRCRSLSSVTVTTRVPPETGSSLFSSASQSLKVIVPMYTGKLYKAVWDFCADNIQETGDSVTLYEVVFDANGGEEVPKVRGAFIIEEPTTKRASESENTYYIFLGWYDNPEGTGDKIAFPYAITEDITLYAAWDLGYYERSLNSGS